MTKSTIKGRCPLINPQKRKAWRQKRKIKNNPEEKPPCRHPWIFLLPFVRHPWMPLLSRCLSFLNGSIRNLNYLRAKNLDSHLLVTPAIFKPGSTVFKNQRKSKNMDSRLKLSGMTEKGGRHPWMPLSGVHKYLKTSGFPIKDFGNDEGGGCPPKFQAWQEKWNPPEDTNEIAPPSQEQQSKFTKRGKKTTGRLQPEKGFTEFRGV